MRFVNHQDWIEFLYRIRVLWCTANHDPGVS